MDYSTIMWAVLLLILGLIGYFIYGEYRLTKHFRDRGLYYFGNSFFQLFSMVVRGSAITDDLVVKYKKVKSMGLKFGCGQEGQNTIYELNDLDIIKQVMVKDFDHFVNRRKFKTESPDSMLARMLITLEGDHWKALRSKMSPTFTTGKIRRMFQILDESGKRMVGYLAGRAEKGSVVDLQEGFSKFTMDFIASAAFGINSQAFHQTGPSKFEEMGGKVQFKFDFINLVKFIVMETSPKLGKLLGFSIFDPAAEVFFSEVIKDTIRRREDPMEAKRVDFIQLMLDAKKGLLKLEYDELNDFEKAQQIKGEGKENAEKIKLKFDEDDIVAQCVLFIIGGFDTTQSALLWAAYNLAIYPDLQQRLFEEVKAAVEENDGELGYEMVNKLEYMEMFISETLRYYPPAIAAERACTKDFKIPGMNEVIKKDSVVVIPIYALHHDPDYYKDEQKFNPERFSPENRGKIHPYAYLPFGMGPRSCIAMRLALVEVKVAIAHLILNFSLEPSEATPIPMKFAKQANLRPEGGMCLKIQIRE